MKSATSNASRAIQLCGTEQPDVPGRVLRAGPMEVEFDNGQLRYLKVGGVEVLRLVAFLVRDENWGTYTPVLSDMRIQEGGDGFTIRFHAVCSRPGQEMAYDASIRANAAEGTLEFKGRAVPKTDFLTARTGFVVLHPLKGVAGCPLRVEHVDGSVEDSRFPAEVNPIQPFLAIRELTHEVSPGLRATVRMEGDTFEMEDHRNWTDASFKTYVRPLALPWPYTLKAGEVVEQSIRVTLSGLPAAGAAAGAATGAAGGAAGGAGAKACAGRDDDLVVRLGKVTAKKLMPLGLGVPAEEIGPALARADLVALARPRFLQCHFDPRQRHGQAELEGYRALAAKAGAEVVLEVVVQSVDAFADELRGVAALVRAAALPLAAVAVCPVGDLKAVLPGGPRPPAPPLPALYAAARAAFPGVRLGGGMFSFFTELNRKRVPTEALDFVMNTTCPIVHAADDRSVMETLEALPYQIDTARSFIGRTPHRVGPSAIGCRDNPHGATFTPNPNNERVCLAKMDPRTRGLFGAAWLLGYVATLARTGIEALAIGAPTGPLGIIHRPGGQPQPYYDGLSGPAVYPGFHVVSGLAGAAGAALVDAASSDSQRLQCLAHRGARGGTTLWLANLTAEACTVRIAGPGAGAAMIGTTLDEASFERATAHPRGFQGAWREVGPSLTLGPYASAVVAMAA